MSSNNKSEKELVVRSFAQKVAALGSFLGKASPNLAFTSSRHRSQISFYHTNATSLGKESDAA